MASLSAPLPEAQIIERIALLNQNQTQRHGLPFDITFTSLLYQRNKTSTSSMVGRNRAYPEPRANQSWDSSGSGLYLWGKSWGGCIEPPKILKISIRRDRNDRALHSGYILHWVRKRLLPFFINSFLLFLFCQGHVDIIGTCSHPQKLNANSSESLITQSTPLGGVTKPSHLSASQNVVLIKIDFPFAPHLPNNWIKSTCRKSNPKRVHRQYKLGSHCVGYK